MHLHDMHLYGMYCATAAAVPALLLTSPFSAPLPPSSLASVLTDQPQLQPNQPQLQPDEPQLQPDEPQLQPDKPQLQPHQPQLQPHQPRLLAHVTTVQVR